MRENYLSAVLKKAEKNRAISFFAILAPRVNLFSKQSACTS